MQDQGLATALVLLGALLHASWNVLVKFRAERLVVMAALNGAGVIFGILLVPFAGLPAAESWPYLLAAAAINAVYQVLLILAYAKGDLGHVYPVIRGVPPVMVAAVVAASGGQVQWPQLAGAALISAGVLSLLLAAPRGGRSPLAFVLALAAGSGVGAYTLLDAAGIERSGATFAYIAYAVLLQNLPLFLFVLATRFRELVAFVGRDLRQVALAGASAVGSYGLVLWALSLGAVVQIAALRETSVIFAAVLAKLLLKEPFGYTRIVVAGVIAAGIIAMKASPH